MQGHDDVMTDPLRATAASDGVCRVFQSKEGQDGFAAMILVLRAAGLGAKAHLGRLWASLAWMSVASPVARRQSR